MSEAGLLAFQIEEVLDAAVYIVCGFLALSGIGLWLYTAHFRGDDK